VARSSQPGVQMPRHVLRAVGSGYVGEPSGSRLCPAPIRGGFRGSGWGYAACQPVSTPCKRLIAACQHFRYMRGRRILRSSPLRAVGLAYSRRWSLGEAQIEYHPHHYGPYEQEPLSHTSARCYRPSRHCYRSAGEGHLLESGSRGPLRLVSQGGDGPPYSGGHAFRGAGGASRRDHGRA
jgi:hypothetical protein